MNEATTVLLASVIGPCPTCRNGRLRPVSDGEQANFFCEECGSCWHPELGWIRRVNPRTCPGCRSAGTCKWAQPANRPLDVAGTRPA